MTEEMIGRECCGSSAGVGSRRASASTLNERTGLDGPASGRANRESIPSEHAQSAGETIRRSVHVLPLRNLSSHHGLEEGALLGGSTMTRHPGGTLYRYRYRISTQYAQTILNAASARARMLRVSYGSCKACVF